MWRREQLDALAALVRWLGPWASDARAPGGIVRETRFTTPRLCSYAYRPLREPIGTWLVVPGLHFLGPDDPRLDRFCRVLARAGFAVVAPHLPSFRSLEVSPAAADDLEVVARALVRDLPALRRPTIFTISFGSLPGLEVAARLGDAIDGVVTFGGYADFAAAVRFCVEGISHTPAGPVELERDPLNAPALFLNLLPHIDVPGGDVTLLRAALLEACRRTWGRSELKALGRAEPIARDIAETLPAAQRELFLVACGVLPGAAAVVERGLARAGAAFAFADPGPALSRLRCPLVVCHGRGDDVIPWHEADKLVLLAPEACSVRRILTGLYGHTGSARPRANDALREGRALLQIVRVLASGGRLREKSGGATIG